MPQETHGCVFGDGFLLQVQGRYFAAVLCRAVPCCAVLCRAVPCCAVLCRAVPCCAVLCRAVPCCAVLCCAVWAVSDTLDVLYAKTTHAWRPH